jgi:prepilin-type N-terminal cleavage/methylation domain-containing protein
MRRGKTMAHPLTKQPPRQKGFSLIEVLIGVFLVAVAVLGLAELYMLGIWNTRRSSEIANSVFLAQQEIDYLRSLTSTELSTFPDISRGESSDALVDVDVDGHPDYRVITVLTNLNPTFDVKVLVFPPSQFDAERDTLVANPVGHGARAQLNTIISR